MKNTFKISGGNKLKTLIFGEPSTGKTTLTTVLWQISDQTCFTERMNNHFREKRNELINGHAIEGTREDHISKLNFTLASPPLLTIRLTDYAGEHASRFLDSESGIVKDLLVDADAVVLLLDSYKISKLNSFKEWADEIKLQNLFHWIREVCSDSHRQSLPFFLVCSRSDLVPPDRLSKAIIEIRKYALEQNLDPEIRTLTVFDHHKSPEPFPPNDVDVPPYDFLIPQKELNTDAVNSLFREIGKLEAKRRRKSALGKISFVFIFIISFLLLGYHVFTPKPLKPQDVADMIRGINDPLDGKTISSAFSDINVEQYAVPLKAVYEHYYRQYRGNPINLSLLDSAYGEVLKSIEGEMAEKIIRYDLENNRWIPSEVEHFFYEYVYFFRKQGQDIPLENLYNRKNEVLIQHNESIETYNMNQLSALAQAFADIRRPLPKILIDTIRTQGGREYLSRRIAERLTFVQNPDTLLFCQQDGIPSIKQSMESYWQFLDDNLKNDYDIMIKYFELIRNTREVRLEAPILRKNRIQVEHPTTFSITPNRTMPNQDKSVFIVPWSLGERIEIEARYTIVKPVWFNEIKKISWSSLSPSIDLDDNGYYIHGLSYLIFHDAKTYGTNQGYTLDFGTIEPRGLFDVPRLLIDANLQRNRR